MVGGENSSSTSCGKARAAPMAPGTRHQLPIAVAEAVAAAVEDGAAVEGVQRAC